MYFAALSYSMCSLICSENSNVISPIVSSAYLLFSIWITNLYYEKQFPDNTCDESDKKRGIALAYLTVILLGLIFSVYDDSEGGWIISCSACMSIMTISRGRQGRMRQSLSLRHAKHKDEESFRAELERIQKKLGLDREIHRQVQLRLSKILIGNICDSIFYAVNKEDDPKLEAYIPFRAFSRYLMAKGFGGVVYRSTRMTLIGLQGKCVTLFNVEDATYIDGEMEVYEYQQNGCKFITKY